MPENQVATNFIYLPSSNFVTMSHINLWDHVNSWKNLWKFWNGPLCRNKSGPFPLLNVAVYWQSSNTEACAKKLSQILANNIDNEGRGIGLRIYVRYYRWYVNGKSFPEIESLISYYSLAQITNEPIHLLSNSSSCNDLIFTIQVTHSGAHSSLHKTCHH